MNYKGSYIIDGMLSLQETKFWKYSPKNTLLAVFVALFWVIVMLFAALTSFLIEAPIRMLVCKGNLKYKLSYQFVCLKSFYNGCKGKK